MEALKWLLRILHYRYEDKDLCQYKILRITNNQYNKCIITIDTFLFSKMLRNNTSVDLRNANLMEDNKFEPT
jgi:hypothetical protein